MRGQTCNVKKYFQESWLTAVTGFTTFVVGAWLLFWNEGRAVETIRSLEEAMEGVVQVSSPHILLDENDGKLIHVCGILETSEPLTEIEYGISVMAVKLKRRVQMYQWVEEEYRRNNRKYCRQFGRVV